MTPRLKPDHTSRFLAWLTGRQPCLNCETLTKPDAVIEGLCLPCHWWIKKYHAELGIALVHPQPEPCKLRRVW